VTGTPVNFGGALAVIFKMS
jgi:hypothetical protein